MYRRCPLPDDAVLSLFHPVIQEWFRCRFQQPTEPQRLGWPPIAAGEHTLISAPTGSGKTLTAFLAVIDRLFRQAAAGKLREELQVIYISPLRALSNDMQRNLSRPLEEIQQTAIDWGIDASPLRTGLRTSDTPAYQRAQLVKRPPQILVTTPESLYLLLTSARSREVLRTVNTVIVDEIHALVRDKRGSHLSLSLERLAALTDGPLQRIGLSATQKPIERVAEFLVGEHRVSVASGLSLNESPSIPSPQPATVSIINVGHARELDLAIEVPPSDLQAACSHEQWAEVNARIVELINSHRSTLIFVNTRRLAERLTHQLTQLLGEDAVGSHHGSLSKEIRLSTERRLKLGELKAVVATSSLELGIDVGYIDLVIQIGSPRGIAPFLQRIGRSGHALGLVPRGRLFALTRDELVECMALIRAVRGGRLDATPIPQAPLDILAQQIVAEVAAEEWSTDALFECFTRAWPYRQLSRQAFDEVLSVLSHGLTENSSRAQALIYHDRINGRIKGRRGARLIAINNGGAIAEVDSVRVVLEDENTVVGSVDEEFAVESSSGDIFLLGNSSWRIQRLRGNDLFVSDAHGAPPTIPFWRGEAPGRTIELSQEIARLREELEHLLIAVEQLHGARPDSPEPTANDPVQPSRWNSIAAWLQEETLCSASAAWQVVNYMASQRAAIGLLPTQKRIVFERFFDESGGMQLVVHAPFGGRINRGWGLAFRKRFCRSFDFELQASADDDGFLLSLGPQHSFPIESLFPMMRTDNARNLLEQALLAVPMFHLRWRWNVTRSLFLARMRNGKKVPPALQRFRSEDLLTAVFPKLTGCQENITGDHEIPDHPIVQQTVDDCMSEAMDLAGLIEVLGRIEQGEYTLVARDTREPSPFAYELLNANPYAFLDGGEVQERRARAVATRRSFSVDSVSDLGRLDPRAIADVVAEAQPEIRDPDELHELLVTRILIPIRTPCSAGEATRAEETCTLAPGEHAEFFETLVHDRRARRILLANHQAWIAVESWPSIAAIFPEALPDSPIELPADLQSSTDRVQALVALLRGWLETCGPITAPEIAQLLSLPVERIFAALEAIEGEGLVLRGRFATATAEMASDSPDIEWCHRRLLARIHRRTISGLRQEIEAVDPAIYLQYLAQHQGASAGHRKQGIEGLHEIVSQLQGLDIAAGAWEKAILPLRVESYQTKWLDELCLSGDVGWGRLEPQPKRKSSGRPMAAMTRAIPVSLYLREDRPWLTARAGERNVDELSTTARDALELLQRQGALFSTDLAQQLQLLPSQLDDVLGELASVGCLTADGFTGLRQLIREGTSSAPAGLPSRYRRVRRAAQGLGRWTLAAPVGTIPAAEEIVEEWAWQLIRRWGVVFRDLVLREPLAPQWWELLKVFRRLEARGELRGGRFISHVSGEQFATSDAIRELRSLRQNPPPLQLLVISAADPLNLTGVLGTGPRIPALTSHQVAYLQGRVVGWKKGDENWISTELSVPHQQRLASEWGIIGFSVSTAEEPTTRSGEPTPSAPPDEGSQKKRRRSPTRSGIPRPFPF